MKATTTSKQYTCAEDSVDQRIRDEFEMEKFAKLVDDPQVKASFRETVLAKALEETTLVRNILLTSPRYKELHPRSNPFEWDLASFHKRLAAGEQFDLLEDEHPETLFIFKVLTDLANVNMILAGIKDGDPSVAASLQEFKEGLAIREKLSNEYNFIRMVGAVYEARVHNIKGENQHEMDMAKQRENELLDSTFEKNTVRKPIQGRYYLGMRLAQHEQHELKLTLRENRLRDEIETIRSAILRHNMASNDTLTCFQRYNNKLKSKIDYFSAKYAIEYEHVDSECTHHQMALFVLQKNLSVCKEKVVFFREECAKTRALMQAEEEAARQKKLDALAAKQALHEAKLKKKREQKKAAAAKWAPKR